MNNTINKKLYAAFAELQKKNDNGISVTRLCEKAGIARATFYLYYKDIDDFSYRVLLYILQKLYDQSRAILFADDSELEKLLAPNNLLFQDNDLILLRHFTQGTAYLHFLNKLAEIMIPKYDRMIADHFGENYMNNDREVCSFFMSGFIPLLYFDLLNYNKNQIVFEMRGIRAVANELFKQEASLQHETNTQPQ